jgi:hypothetical protein
VVAASGMSSLPYLWLIVWFCHLKVAQQPQRLWVWVKSVLLCWEGLYRR